MKAKTISEIRREGLEVLAKAMGPIGMVRFVQSFDLGRGDYTKERSQWLSESLDEIFKEIKQIWEEKYDSTMLEIFGGNIEIIDERKGFVIMDISGERLYFNPIRGMKDKTFQKGQRVKYNIAFNYIAPQAINLEKV